MTTPLDSMALWRRTLGVVDSDVTNAARERLRQSFLSFRDRVAHLVSTIGAELPGLTVHDITHLDALWRVADVIAGDDYPLNPAEAYVLGGAFLLHDAAHVAVAYPDGLAGIRRTVQWQDLIAQRYGGKDPDHGSGDEKFAIFQVLRHLHADRARELPAMQWSPPDAHAPFHLIEDYELREYYGDLIGEIASSHHWSPHKVAERFAARRVSCPAALASADWEVDALKLALLLRTADAAHLDEQRAPWFLFALRQPQGVSQDHWRFQAKMGKPSRTTDDQLLLSAGSPFTEKERNAWWLALDTARMVDRELRSAHDILREEGRVLFKTSRVSSVESAQSFAKPVPVRGWEPIEVMPSVSDVPKLIERLGGAALYGDDPTVALRELLQNALDAVAALRAIGGLGSEEGEIEISLQPEAGSLEWWILSVTDTGIGMSRHVLSSVLLDFGNSFWSSDAVREELPGLSAGDFKPIGKFGIGFYSVFMLGDDVTVTTCRFQNSSDELNVQSQIRFESGLSSRPVLVNTPPAERLPRPGSRVRVRVGRRRIEDLLRAFALSRDVLLLDSAIVLDDLKTQMADLISHLCPASHTDLFTTSPDGGRKRVVSANDWLTVTDDVLLRRLDSSAKILLALRSREGRIFGRVGFSGNAYSDGATIVFRGISCGHLNSVTGIVEASANNLDAQRKSAIPAGALEEWRIWAEQILSKRRLLKKQLLAIHPIIPARDLPVFSAQGKVFAAKQLVRVLKRFDKIFVHVGDISYDDEQNMSESQFESSFEPVDQLFFVPTTVRFSRDAASTQGFPWFLGVSPVDYEGVFEQALKRAWGLSDQIASEHELEIVGHAHGEEIYRFVDVYDRLTSEKK